MSENERKAWQLRFLEIEDQLAIIRDDLEAVTASVDKHARFLGSLEKRIDDLVWTIQYRDTEK